MTNRPRLKVSHRLTPSALRKAPGPVGNNRDTDKPRATGSTKKGPSKRKTKAERRRIRRQNEKAKPG